MAGYYSCSKNYSMSKRAEYAYSCGERPISKWTKKEVLEMVADEYSYWDDFELIENFVKKTTLKEIKEKYLKYTGWHHTGKFYNITEFYELNLDRIIIKAEEFYGKEMVIKEKFK